MLAVETVTTDNARADEIKNAKIVLGIVRRRPIKQVKTSDLPRLIAMCERVADEAESNSRSEKFSDLALKLAAELHLREKGSIPFAAKTSDRYTAKEIPAKAVQALQVLGKIVARFEALGLANEKGSFLIEYTTNEALAAFEKGEAYGEKTRAAFLPKVFRHLLAQIAKNLKDPVSAVQAFTNDVAKIEMLDAAWSKPTDEKPETVKKPIKVVTEGGHTRQIHPNERIIGKRATFHVHREVNGEKGFEPCYAQTIEDAVAEVESMYGKAKTPVRIYAVVVCAEKKL